jgi:hypothetical protein
MSFVQAVGAGQGRRRRREVVVVDHRQDPASGRHLLQGHGVGLGAKQPDHQGHAGHRPRHEHKDGQDTPFQEHAHDKAREDHSGDPAGAVVEEPISVETTNTRAEPRYGMDKITAEPDCLDPGSPWIDQYLCSQKMMWLVGPISRSKS